MKFENTQVWGFVGALRGMRNPKESWNKNDTSILEDGTPYVGPNDMDLALRLVNAGPEHRKFLRMIHVQVDITAPLYWWKEFDKYQVAVVTNSTSTMHKIQSKPITLDCFETDDFQDFECYNSLTKENSTHKEALVMPLIATLESLRKKYNETKDVRYWKELIRWLPESWLQTRTVDMNYETLRAICSLGQRRNHKLTEWRKSFIGWARQLPYAQEFLFTDELAKN